MIDLFRLKKYIYLLMYKKSNILEVRTLYRNFWRTMWSKMKQSIQRSRDQINIAEF